MPIRQKGAVAVGMLFPDGAATHAPLCPPTFGGEREARLPPKRGLSPEIPIERGGPFLWEEGLFVAFAQADFLGQRSPLLGIVWGDHGIVGRQIPAAPIFLRRHVVVGF